MDLGRGILGEILTRMREGQEIEIGVEVGMRAVTGIEAGTESICDEVGDIQCP